MSVFGAKQRVRPKLGFQARVEIAEAKLRGVCPRCQRLKKKVRRHVIQNGIRPVQNLSVSFRTVTVPAMYQLFACKTLHIEDSMHLASHDGRHLSFPARYHFLV